MKDQFNEKKVTLKYGNIFISTSLTNLKKTWHLKKEIKIVLGHLNVYVVFMFNFVILR